MDHEGISKRKDGFRPGHLLLGEGSCRGLYHAVNLPLVDRTFQIDCFKDHFSGRGLNCNEVLVYCLRGQMTLLGALYFFLAPVFFF